MGRRNSLRQKTDWKSASCLTPEVLSRHSLLAGGIGTLLDNLYQYLLASRSVDYNNTEIKTQNAVDISHFIELLRKENLVKYQEQRSFNSHSNFVHHAVNKPQSLLVTKLISLSTKLE